MFQRGSRYWLRVVAPLDLQAKFYSGKKIAFEGSLGTSDPEVARAAAAAKRAELEAQFLRQRRELSPPILAKITPEMRRCIVETLLAQEVSQDAAQRLDKTRSTTVYSGAVASYANEDGTGYALPPHVVVPPLRPLSSNIVTARATVNQSRLKTVRAAVASGNLEVMVPIVGPIVKRLGLAIDYETEDGVMLLQEALGAYASAREVAVKRDAGEVVPTPPMPDCAPVQIEAVPETPAAPSPSVTPSGDPRMQDLFEDWKALKTRAKPAIKITERSIGIMRELGLDIPLAQLDRQHGAKMRAHLVSQGLRGQSIKNLVAPIQALLNVGVDNGKLAINPWAGLKIDTSDSVQRLPWRLEDLKKLADTNALREQDDAGRWLFPLMMHTGCRIGEVAQLELADIRTIDGVYAIEIHDRASEGHRNRTVKTKAGERVVPVHPRLIALGFREYVEARRTAGDRFLFPRFIQNGSRLPSELAGRDFLKLRTDAGITIDERWSAHSIRHNVRSTLAAAGINDTIIDRVVGHESGSVRSRYTHAQMPALVTAIAALDWSAVGL
jgi:integrase